MDDKTWDGISERRGENRQDMLNLVLSVRELSLRFDNELGAANGFHEGSVKRHLRDIQSAVNSIREILLGDGKGNIGLAAQIRNNSEALDEHKEWDKWLFLFIAAGQLIAVVIMIYGTFNKT